MLLIFFKKNLKNKKIKFFFLNIKKPYKNEVWLCSRNDYINVY